jgi:hypothetical protein
MRVVGIVEKDEETEDFVCGAEGLWWELWNASGLKA